MGKMEESYAKMSAAMGEFVVTMYEMKQQGIISTGIAECVLHHASNEALYYISEQINKKVKQLNLVQ